MSPAPAKTTMPNSSCSSVLVWACAVGICLGMKRLIAGPALLQLLLGIVVFAGAGLIYIRSPVLCRSDRDLLLRLLPGREMRVLRALGLGA